MDINHKKRIEELITHVPVFIFMKGTVEEPACQFSAHAVHLLQEAGAQNIEYFNVLEDEAMRQAIKDYTGWPTIPQVFIDGKFVGGADVLQEIYDRGELKAMVA